jgi:hypothetical protein
MSGEFWRTGLADHAAAHSMDRKNGKKAGRIWEYFRGRWERGRIENCSPHWRNQAGSGLEAGLACAVLQASLYSAARKRGIEPERQMLRDSNMPCVDWARVLLIGNIRLGFTGRSRLHNRAFWQ